MTLTGAAGLAISSGTIQGTRDRNDDRHLIAGNTVALADGAGPSGATAAEAATIVVLEAMRLAISALEDAERLFRRADDAVRKCPRRAESTLVVATLDTTGLATGTVAWLGDVVLAASDQSVHNALERLGSFASVRHSQLGRVMRSVAYEQFGMNDGDRLLIASDGLRCIPTAEVRDVLVSAATTARCIDTLVRLAAGSATDNSTVIVIEYRQSQVLDDVRGGHAPAVSEQGRLPAGGDTPDHGRAGKSTLLLGHDRC